MAAKSGFTLEDLAQMGPDEITRKRRLAEALIAQNAGLQDIKSPWQGFAQLANALVGNLKEARLDRAEREGKEGANALFGAGMGTGVFPPAPGGGGGAGNASPPPSGVADGPKGQEAYAAPTGGGDIEGYIRQAAQARGIDPDVAVRVAMSEGGLKDPVRQSDYVKNGRREESYGPFQLLMNGGVGERALKAGIDPRDPSQWQRGVDFALDEAAKQGWGQWYGAARAGIGNRAGLDGARALGAGGPIQVASNDPSAGMAAGLQAQGFAPDSEQAQAFARLKPGAGAVPPASGTIPPPMQPSPQGGQQAQLAQAMIGDDRASTLGAPPITPGGPDIRTLMNMAGNEFMNPMQQRMIQALTGQRMDEANPEHQLDMEYKRAQLQKLQQPGKEWQRLDDNTLFNPATGETKETGGMGNAKFDDVSGVRKEIVQLPSYKNLSQAVPIYKSMVETAGRDNKASDLNLVYGLGKIMDPTSVVREGELHMANDTQGMADYLNGIIKGIQGEGRLSPEARAQIMTEAYGRVKAYQDVFGVDTQMYRGIADRSGMNAADILPNLGEGLEPWTPAPTTEVAPPAASAPLAQPRKTKTGVPWSVQ